MRRVWAVVLVLVATGCVTIAPIPTGSPGTTEQPRTAAPGSPGASLPTTPGHTLGPTPSASEPDPTHCCPETPPGPGPTIDPALAAQIDAVIAQVPAIRQLEPLTDVPYEFISRDQFRDDLIELQFEEVPEETLRAEERLLKRLGLLPDDADLLGLLVELYGAQVAAFYRPDTKRFYIIERDQPFGATDKIIVAHEYTHALQDQHFDLEGTRITDLTQGDAVLGQLGAIEGDATLTMQLWMLEPGNLSPEEALEILFESFGQLNDPTLASMPPVLRRQLEYPYVEGLSFIQEIYDAGGFDAVNATLSTAIPASTEQVLHPDTYLAGEAPVAVSLPDATAALGDGWQNVYQQTMGELLMQVWAAGDETPQTIPGLPVDWPHAETVAGWGGDRLAMYEHPDGRWAMLWEVAWDSRADGDEFIARVLELESQIDGETLIGRQEPTGNVQIIAGSDAETLSAVVSLP